MNKMACSLGISFALQFATVATMHAQQLGLDQGWSIGGQALTRGQSADFIRHFSAGTEYVIYADGSQEALDIDLQVLDASGRVVAQDRDSDKAAAVAFTPRRSGQYTLRLQLASARGRALAYFAVFTVGEGWNVPQRDVAAAFGRLTAVASHAQFANYEIRRFYGFIMRPGEMQSMTLSGVPTGSHVAVAVGDDLADDLDIAVLQNGRVLGYDTLYDALPIASFNARAGSLEMRVSYETGSGPALVLMALLERESSQGFGSGRSQRL
jgi:hypothetical protein